MNIKVAGFTALTLGILGYFMADGLPPGRGDVYSKALCMKSIEKQADKDLFKTIDPAGLCGCLADLKLTRDTAEYKTVKSCLDKTLRSPIINACESDEAAKQAMRDRPKTPEEDARQDAEDALIGPSMNCECVADRSSEWVWKNFEAAMRSKTLGREEASQFANTMIDECKWK